MRAKGLRVSTTWATLAAIGASAVFSALASAALAAITLEPLPQGGWFQHLSEERVIEWSALAAAAAGVVVGGWLGGVRAVSLFLAYFVLITAHAVEGALEAARVCQDGRLGCLADLPVSGEDALFRQQPSLIGIAIGSVLALLIRRLPCAPLYPLGAAGVCALTLVPLGILAGVHDLRAGPVAVIASMPDVPALLAFVALSAAAGLFIAARSPSARATTIQFVAFGAVFLLPASTSAAMHGRGVEAFFAFAVASLAVGVVSGLATVLGRRLRASVT